MSLFLFPSWVKKNNTDAEKTRMRRRACCLWLPSESVFVRDRYFGLFFFAFSHERDQGGGVGKGQSGRRNELRCWNWREMGDVYSREL